MKPIDVPVSSATAHHIQATISSHASIIETWLSQQWAQTPAAVTSSVDLRDAGFKLSPVDTNLFPAGFNNLAPDVLPVCVRAMQSVLAQYIPHDGTILLLPENHTRNTFYLSNVHVLRDILIKSGYSVRIGSLDPELQSPIEMMLDDGNTLLFEPLQRRGNQIGLEAFEPHLLLLNNDLSSGVPEILHGVAQKIMPTAKLGWASRLKSSHFQFFHEVVSEFSEHVGMDPWFIEPYFSALDGVDFMSQEGLDKLAISVDNVLSLIRSRYAVYDIPGAPFVVVKADSGTYGMNVIMVHDADEIRQLNRKQRTKMSSSKGHRRVDRVIVQEGVYTVDTTPDGATAEPVVYLIGSFVVGGFYRVHSGRGVAENLNAPGMHFEPLSFEETSIASDASGAPNRFYVYSVVARLAALAAAREIAATGESV